MAAGVEKEELLKTGDVIRQRFRVVNKLGEGGFGMIFVVEDTVNHQMCVAKIEQANQGHEVLKMEVAVLRKLQGITHACRYISGGREPREKPRFNFLVIKLLGKTLADLRSKSIESKFKPGTALRVGIQVLQSIQDLHKIGFLHRDIKPSNFAIGREESNKKTVFMLDFGLARQYLQSNGKIRLPREAVGFRGTVRHASIAAHKSKDQGPKDDIWGMFYMVIESIKGQLPWRKETKKDDALKIKEETKLDELIKGCPREFSKIHEHLSSLDYFDQPNYDLLEMLLKAPLSKLNVKMEDPFEWEAAAPKPIKADKPPSRQERLKKAMKR